ncbi:MAG: tetratricopeptide repeat protein [Verrucomicrobiota bacterium]
MSNSIQQTGRALAMVLLLATGLHADTLVLKNGQTISGKSFLREGDVLTVSAGPAGEPVTAGAGVNLAEIAKVECDRPAAFKSVPLLLASGKSIVALENVQAALKSAEVFGQLPGSHWPDLFVLQAHILLAMGKDDEAVKLASAMEKTKLPDLVQDAQALRALIAARKGDHGTATSLLDALGRDSSRPSIVAAASVARGLGHLEKKRFEEALKSFLELPVFLPDETAFSAMARLGAAQAYQGLEDADRAIAALEDLIKTQPGTPEISIAKSLLPEWKRRRSVVLEAKEP